MYALSCQFEQFVGVSRAGLSISTFCQVADWLFAEQGLPMRDLVGGVKIMVGGVKIIIVVKVFNYCGENMLTNYYSRG